MIVFAMVEKFWMNWDSMVHGKYNFAFTQCNVESIYLQILLVERSM
jgi:hypothetical protein